MRGQNFRQKMIKSPSQIFVNIFLMLKIFVFIGETISRLSQATLTLTEVRGGPPWLRCHLFPMFLFPREATFYLSSCLLMFQANIFTRLNNIFVNTYRAARISAVQAIVECISRVKVLQLPVTQMLIFSVSDIFKKVFWRWHKSDDIWSRNRQQLRESIQWWLVSVMIQMTC